LIESSLGFLQQVIFNSEKKVISVKSGCEKISLHINGAKRRRVLKREKLGRSNPGISTSLSTLVLKS